MAQFHQGASYSNGFFLRAVDIFLIDLKNISTKIKHEYVYFPVTILGQNQNRKRSPSYRGLSVD